MDFPLASPKSPVTEKFVKDPSKLILCFDGTGNQYLGNPSDTNIVKLYQKFDREADKQYHYYQPGIGTYTTGDQSVNTTWWGQKKRSISQTLDEGYGTSFDSHVIAGYKFIMRYYSDGDKIYIFGFSRGAFTARFLARMLTSIGLLSMGNEEMVPFAYKKYQDSQIGLRGMTNEDQVAAMESFKTTFCRRKVKVHFLGLFDTVNSVGVFDVPSVGTTTTVIAPAGETADNVRHAVSIDERRAKFKAALLAQEPGLLDSKSENVREVWFSGNHGDIGGGWFPGPDAQRTAKRLEDELDPKNYGKTKWDSADEREFNDPVQLSDLTLEWMITELEKIEAKELPQRRLVWNYHRDLFKANFYSKIKDAVTAPKHDVLAYKSWNQDSKEKNDPKLKALKPPMAQQWLISQWSMTAFWWFLEILPFKRIELENRKWTNRHFPTNFGHTRDIPQSADATETTSNGIPQSADATETTSTKVEFHPSVKARMLLCPDYEPTNTGLHGHRVLASTKIIPKWNHQDDVICKHIQSIVPETLL